MPIRAKNPIADSDHAKSPDFSIPGTAAILQGAAAQHHEEAARHYRQAATDYQFGHYEKSSHRAHSAYAHHLHEEQHAEEADRDDSHELAKEIHNKSGRIETFSSE